MVSVGLIAVDGTKLHANASMSANRSYEKITKEILAEAAAADAQDDTELGDLRGNELPAHLVSRSSRKARLKAAKERLEGEVKTAQQAHRERAKERAALERERGSKLRGRKPKPPARRVAPSARANVTDPDSRLVRGPKGFLQGYNAQAATSERQIILAAELSVDSADGRLLEPMVEPPAPSCTQPVSMSSPAWCSLTLATGTPRRSRQSPRAAARLLVNPDASAQATRTNGKRKLRDKRVTGLYAHMQRVMLTEHGSALYARRQPMIEPVFAHTKVIRGADRFQRRGFAACRSEWRLIAATHNLLKLWRHGPTLA